MGIVFGFSENYLLTTVSLQESVQVVQPFLGSAKEAILLRDALLTLTSSPGVDHYLQVSTEVCTSLKDVNFLPNYLSIDFTQYELEIVKAFYLLFVCLQVREQVKQFIDSADSAKSTALRVCFCVEYCVWNYSNVLCSMFYKYICTFPL